MNPQANRFFTAIRNWPRASMLVLVAILLAMVTGAFWYGKRNALAREEADLDRSSDGHQHYLGLQIGRYFLVPEVLAASKGMRALLLRPNAASVREQNEILEETARRLRLDVIYVLKLNGDALAASNWREQDSVVGHNFSFRPYFQQALAGQTGRYIGNGVQSFKLGYYLSRPVLVDGEIRGVVVVKISLDAIQLQLEKLWRQHAEIVVVADGNTVVVVSPFSALLFKSMRPISAAVRAEIKASRQYRVEIAPAPMMLGDSLSVGIRFVEFNGASNQSLLQRAYYLPDIDVWLYLYVPASRYWTAVAEFTGMFSLAALVIFLTAVGIFQRWAYGAKLMEAAIHDPLTGLHTRLYMNDWCNAAMRAHSRDPAAGFGLAVFDLDLFKRVNDTYGHLAGDSVLKQVGTIIRSTIRGEDLAVRFGGEELAVFVRCAELGVAVALAERIRRGVEQTEFQSKSGRMPVSLSGGVAYHAVGEALDALFARADKKLYEAKEAGRNRICS